MMRVTSASGSVITVLAALLSLWSLIVDPHPAFAATTTYTFPVIADAMINEGQSSNNYGSSANLFVAQTPQRHALLRFAVTGIGSNQVASAKLQLYGVDSSVQGGDVHQVANSWSEGGVTWGTAPSALARIGSLGNVKAGAWSEVDLTSLITGDGMYSLRIVPISTDGAGYNSKEAGASRSPRLVVAVSAPLLAFPGAQGFGATTPGGRGGRVIAVTNLNDSGPGSLRSAIDTVGSRIVIFRVGGTIKLLSPLNLLSPYITIAGQTAPGGGITVRKDPASPDRGPTLVIQTHDVVIRYLRLRPGSEGTSAVNALDAVTIMNAARVVFDHVSMSWAIDENFNIWDNTQDVTVQWSIVSEALHHSTHVLGPHSCGVLIGGLNSDRVSLHHNLFAHNYLRNPRIAITGLVDIVNNVIYNYGSQAGILTDFRGPVAVNYVGNYVKPGPSSSRSQYELKTERTGPGFSIYVFGNIGHHRLTDTGPQDAVVAPDSRAFVVPSRHAAAAVTTTTAFIAYTDVLAKAGAVRVRDSVDQAVVSSVQSGTGRIIDHPNDVGGYPNIASGTPPLDSDGDGMPDAWEIAHGLNPFSDDSAGDYNGDGYTNIEKYINSLTP